MKTELEAEDVERIAERVMERLKLHVSTNTKQEDVVFDKEALAKYLHVDTSWIDKQITKRAIPFFKVGKYTRFKRSHIDRWIEDQKVEPVPELKRYRSR